MRNTRRATAIAMAVAGVLAFAACGSDSNDRESSDTAANCQAKDVYGNKFNHCELMDQDQVTVEATVGRRFEIEGSGMSEVGQKVRVVCHTGDIGHSSFGILVGQDNDRSGDDWTLGKVNGAPFAHVSMIIEVAVNDHERVVRELNDKLESKLGNPRADSCSDARVIASNGTKELLESSN